MHIFEDTYQLKVETPILESFYRTFSASKSRYRFSTEKCDPGNTSILFTKRSGCRIRKEDKIPNIEVQNCSKRLRMREIQTAGDHGKGNWIRKNWKVMCSVSGSVSIPGMSYEFFVRPAANCSPYRDSEPFYGLVKTLYDINFWNPAPWSCIIEMIWV